MPTAKQIEAAYKIAREWMDVAIQAVRPGVGTDQIAKLWPKAGEFGFANEMAAFGLQFGHGLGLGLHERPPHGGIPEKDRRGLQASGPGEASKEGRRGHDRGDRGEP